MKVYGGRGPGGRRGMLPRPTGGGNAAGRFFVDLRPEALKQGAHAAILDGTISVRDAVLKLNHMEPAERIDLLTSPNMPVERAVSYVFDDLMAFRDRIALFVEMPSDNAATLLCNSAVSHQDRMDVLTASMMRDEKVADIVSSSMMPDTIKLQILEDRSLGLSTRAEILNREAVSIDDVTVKMIMSNCLDFYEKGELMDRLEPERIVAIYSHKLFNPEHIAFSIYMLAMPSFSAPKIAAAFDLDIIPEDRIRMLLQYLGRKGHDSQRKQAAILAAMEDREKAQRLG
ncbi:MAG: hypothetical protein WC527_05415 [Candidatus Margulisiibacteriota bacterium]